MNKHLLPALFGLSLAPALAVASGDHHHHSLDGHQHHGQHAHVHGEANMTLVRDGNQIVIQLKSPAFNLTGFEHQPKDDKERAMVNATAHQLKQFDSLFKLPKQAGCKLQTAKVDSILMDKEHAGHNHNHDHDHDKTSGATAHAHADFYVDYELNCQQPEQLKTLQVMIFKPFPAIEKVRLQWVLESGQGAAIATPKSATVSMAK